MNALILQNNGVLCKKNLTHAWEFSLSNGTKVQSNLMISEMISAYLYFNLGFILFLLIYTGLSDQVLAPKYNVDYLVT